MMPIVKPLAKSSYTGFYKPRVYRKKIWTTRIKWRKWLYLKEVLFIELLKINWVNLLII
jgi:hypothetical protein